MVVDNASQDGTVAMLECQHPQVEVVKAEANLGFAGGANLGMAHVASPIIVLLNNDAIAHPEMLAAFVRALEAPATETIAAVTGKVVLHGDGRLNSTGNLVSRTGRGYDRDWRRRDDGSRASGDVFAFCGAATALRSSALRQVGGFDEELFLYYEDTDLSWRLRAAGWAVRYEPRAIAVHRHAASSREGSPMFHFWNERNSLIVFPRHAPANLVFRMLLRRTVGLFGTPFTRASPTPLRERVGAQRRPTYGDCRGRRGERRAIWRDAQCSRHKVATLLTARPWT